MDLPLNWASDGGDDDFNGDVQEMVRSYVKRHPPDEHHGGGIHGRTHTPPPAAVAQLKARMMQNGRKPVKATNQLAKENVVLDNEPKPTIEEAHQRYMAGESVKTLGEEMGITWQALMKQWRELGLSRRPALKDGQVGGGEKQPRLVKKARPVEQAVVNNGRTLDRSLDTVAVADGMDRMISLGRLVRELQGAGVGVKVSGRVVVELEF